jgi:hypothetical protein
MSVYVRIMFVLRVYYVRICAKAILVCNKNKFDIYLTLEHNYGV